MRLLLFSVSCLIISSSLRAGDQAAELTTLKAQVQGLEEEVHQLRAEMDVGQEEYRLLLRRTQLNYQNQFYVKLGSSLIFPRRRTFSFNTDTGLGAFAGMGRYFGKNHVLDVSFDWDIYPSMTVQYRLEFHTLSPLITWGPVLGYKQKLVDRDPIDHFLDNPDGVNSSFWEAGVILGFPLVRSMIAMQFLYVTNTQAFFFATVAFHVFF